MIGPAIALEAKCVEAGARLLMIGAAKEPDMNQERPEPVDRLPLLPAFGKATGFVEHHRWLVEEAQHRKIDLPVAIIAGRIDKTRYMIALDENIPAP